MDDREVKLAIILIVAEDDTEEWGVRIMDSSENYKPNDIGPYPDWHSAELEMQKHIEHCKAHGLTMREITMSPRPEGPVDFVH